MTDGIKIEKDVPMPSTSRTKKPHGEISLALSKMEVGDSFPISGENLGTLQSRIRQAAKRVGVRVTIRPEGEKTVRVWRIADAVKKVAKKEGKA